MNFSIRKASEKDLDFLVKVENESFPEFQQIKVKRLIRSLKSRHFQEVWIIEIDKIGLRPAGSLILYKYRKTLRIFSIGILPEFQSTGLGSVFMEFAKKRARKLKLQKIRLEVHFNNRRLLEWYLNKGYEPKTAISDYYYPGEDALKMELLLNLHSNTKIPLLEKKV